MLFFNSFFRFFLIFCEIFTQTLSVKRIIGQYTSDKSLPRVNRQITKPRNEPTVTNTLKNPSIYATEKTATTYCIMRVRIKVYLETIIIIQQRKQIVLKMKKSTKKVKESTAASRQTEDGAIKEITPKKRKKGRYILIYLAIIGFVFYAVITIINQNVQIAEKKAELTDLQQQISVVEIQSQYLKKVQNYKGDDLKKYIEKIAKDELGYVGDGERIFINVAGE